MATESYETLPIQKLEALVRRHNRLYFVEHRPTIPDTEFDRLVETLRRRKPDSPVLEEVGSDWVVGERSPVRHAVPMLSLDKCYTESAALDWVGKFSGAVIATPKIDGCAVSLRYDAQGHLVQAATRGNGLIGEEITANVRHIPDIPQHLSVKILNQPHSGGEGGATRALPVGGATRAPEITVRGEVYMPLSVFREYADAFANPRNLAAGAIKQKDPRKTGAYRLRFWAYDLLGAQCSTEAERRTQLAALGFPAIEWKEIAKEAMHAVFEDFLARRHAFDFETDGVVFKANAMVEQERLGSTIHHPRYAIAYKFQGDSGVTRLVDIVWSVSRTGTITPVGIVEPVQLSGASVTRVTLHHYGQLKKLGVTKGAKVLMMRRGGVIPNLESVVKPGHGAFAAPTTCPSCGAPVEVREDFLYCTNGKGCLRTKIGALKHFMRVIDCEGFGDKLLEKLVTEGLVSDPADFYTLAVKDLVALERMGETLAAKLIAHIQERRVLPLDQLLRALGIRELAKRTSQLLAGFGTFDRVLALTAEELADLHGIGEKIAEEVVSGLKAKRSLINRLLKFVAVKKPATGDRRPATGSFVGKSVLFTGTLLAMERKHAQALAEKNGGIIASGVSTSLDYLVVGDGGGAGSKLTKAQKFVAEGSAMRILSEKEFLKLIGHKA